MQETLGAETFPALLRSLSATRCSSFIEESRAVSNQRAVLGGGVTGPGVEAFF